MNDLQENEIHIQATKSSPGKRLKQAREGRGLSRKDIAERLNLSEQVIDAIETDDQDHLPGHTFVRGYLRSYASLIALDADSIIADYNNFFSDIDATQEVRETALRSVGRKRGSKSKKGKIGAYLALVLCVVAGIGYFSGQEPTEDMSSQPEAEGNSESNNVNNIVDANNLQEVQQLSEDEEQAVKLASEDDSINVDSGENQEEYAEKVKEIPKLSSWDNFNEAEGDDEKVVVSQERDTKKDSGPMKAGSLSLQFHADAWTEVYDASGERLLYRLGREGRTYQVSGAVPFKVLLGNAKEVTVLLNGELFDQTPFIRGQVARFSAGE